ncbi:MAG TPA: POTRA domain-containing protein, partial [Rhodocyclaceae bacterium]|nr:POTRA domain-containing protein [Rhodocyclaceae bacterium]
MKKATIRLAAVLIALAAAPQIDALGQDITFDIVRFQVEGNSLLTAERIDRLTSPFIGRHKRYGDVQKALEALDNEYRRLGYGTVNVYVPEQELATGVVRLQVTEAVIDKIAIVGNKHFDTENIRASLPLLKEGIAPNMRQLSENIQLSNENPAKQVEVTLGVSDDENKVNAKIQVTEENPIRTFLTLDNTGAKASGKSRIGVSWQNANVFNADQVLTLAYTTTPDAPSGVKVDIFSVGYRLPIYAIGDSIDLIYGNSSTNTPSISPNLGAGLAINGKGQVLGLRYNHIFPRQGEYSSRLVAGFDYKYMNTRCIDPATGASFSIDPPIPGNAACTPYTLRPVSATYSGQWLQPGQIID